MTKAERQALWETRIAEYKKSGQVSVKYSPPWHQSQV
ncbi:hypothetical protein MCACP_14100 [Neomoorella carbonis]